MSHDKNTIAQRVFEKKGFLKKGVVEREYREERRSGLIYVKRLT